MSAQSRTARKRSQQRTAVSLFSGAGGLDLGLEAAGFKVRLCVENDEDARTTVSNQPKKWRLSEPGDVFQLPAEQLLCQARIQPRELTLLAAGPPCQPFSKAAYWANGDSPRLKDPRAKTLDAMLDIVQVALPQVLLLENVAGLAYSGKTEGVERIQDRLLEINAAEGTNYKPVQLNLNAAAYGVPQIRERIFIVAHREGLTIDKPPETHCPPDSEEGLAAGLQPYLTAWDAIGDLDKRYCLKRLKPTGKWAGLLPSVPEGQNYLWLTPRGDGESVFAWRSRYWSFLLKLAKNRPSWTIPAEPGPATGPFHWRSRLLSERELCRIQTFPDGYEIHGSRRSVQRQIGNAVPPLLGEVLALHIRRQLLGERRVPRKLKLLPLRQGKPPRPVAAKPVPPPYRHLIGAHPDHPGSGKGPGALRRKALEPE